MAADFHPALDRDLDFVRQEIGDIGANGVFLRQNETIDALLANYVSSSIGAFNATIASLLRGLIGQYANIPDAIQQAGGTATQWKQRLDSWRELLKRAEKGNIPDPIGQGKSSNVSTVSTNVARF